FYELTITNDNELDSEIEHNIQIIISDVYGNEPDNAELTFNIDATPPIIVVNSPDSEFLSSSTIFEATITDDETSINNETVTLRLENSEDSTLFVEKDYDLLTVIGSTYSYQFTLLDLLNIQGDELSNIDAIWTASNMIGEENINESSYVVDVRPPDYTENVPLPDGTYEYGEQVVLDVSYEDSAGTWEYGGNTYYSGASGIDEDNVVIYLNGEPVLGRNTNVSNLKAIKHIRSIQSIKDVVGTQGSRDNNIFHIWDDLEPGEYTGYVHIPDMVGNVTDVPFAFTILAPGPTIEFDPFAGGYWFNPSLNDNPFTFTVYTTQGAILADDGVVVNFYEEPNYILLQGPMTVPFTEIIPGEYSVEVYLGSDLVSDDAIAVILNVTATTTTGDSTTSNQSYGVDIYPPEIDFANAVLPDPLVELGDEVNISVSYEDNLSGIDTDNVTVYLNGIAQAAIVTEGNVMCTLEIIEIGNYTLVVSVPDMVSNVETLEYSFVVGVTPNIVVDPYGGGYWLNPELISEPFTFTVLDNDGNAIPNCEVVVNFYDDLDSLLQGPTAPSGSNGEYSVEFVANVPESSDELQLEVIAEAGFVTEYTQIFSIDRDAPVIDFANAVLPDPLVELGDEVNISVSY
ncbi:MAG: Ig-like domain-containing protein, partial [Candidatus Cloacimonetes bacterium]|nr:Ig-like domain-containing protein [Candidatus Cloacimonadota bacterium]